MRVLIAISCLLAVASAVYHHGYHIPVIGPHGVPLDEPAVAHARAEHAAAHSKAAANAGPSYHDDGHYNDGHYNDGQYNNGHYDNGQYDDGKYNGHNEIGQYDNGQYDDGSYHGEGQSAGYSGDHGHATHYHGPLHYPVISKHGVPVDEPAVQHARAEHAAAHASAHGHGHYRRRRGVYNYGGLYHGAQHVPVIGPHGVPHDEPAVAHARAEHAAAHAKAAAHGGSGHYDDGHYDDGQYHAGHNDDGHYNSGHNDGGHYAEGNYAESYGHGKWHGPIHIPVIDKHGVPVEDHAIKQARAEHIAAHAAVSHKGYHVTEPVAYAGDYGYGGHGSSGHYHGPQHIPVIGPHGVPKEEPAVIHARAEHAAAHAAASHGGHGGHHQW